MVLKNLLPGKCCHKQERHIKRYMTSIFVNMGLMFILRSTRNKHLFSSHMIWDLIFVSKAVPKSVCYLRYIPMINMSFSQPTTLHFKSN